MVQRMLFAKQKYKLIENKHMDTKGEGGGMSWETGIDISTTDVHVRV